MDGDRVESSVVCEDGVITSFSGAPLGATRIDARGCAVLPGLIDAHTHLVFGGDRVGEFRARSAGATYEDIAKEGGGIWKTVLATREASEMELFALAMPRLKQMIARGVTTVEGKGGYGLALEDERKILRVYRQLQHETGVDIVTTFLALHALPRGRTKDAYVEESLTWLETLHKEGLVDGVDVFVETTAFSLDDAKRTGEVAHRLGLPLRLHVDQLTEGKGAALAAELGAASADHLENMREEDASTLAEAGVVATLLPWASLFVSRGKKPPVARLREAGVKMAIATDFNPGSAPVLDMHATMALAVGYFGMSVEEVLRGVTTHAADALKIPAGVIKLGARADLVVLDHEDPTRLCYEVGNSPVRMTVKSGAVIFKRG
jgi:imidazolonepropionase